MSQFFFPGQPDLLVTLQGLHQLRQKRFQPLATQEVGRCPDILEGLVKMRIARPSPPGNLPLLEPWTLEQGCGMLAAVASRLDDDVENPCPLLLAGTPVQSLVPPYQLGLALLGHLCASS